MPKITAPLPEPAPTGGILFADSQVSKIYAFLAELETEFNNLIGGYDDPSESPLSYVDYLIIKLKLSQNFFPAGLYFEAHVAPAHLENFLTRMKAETRWRLADGDVSPETSWLVKGDILNLPDARGVVLRGYDDAGLGDPDGWQRLLGSFQDYALKTHWHNTNFNIRYPTVGSSSPDYWVMRNDYGDNIRTTNTNDTLLSDSEARMKNITALILILT